VDIHRVSFGIFGALFFWCTQVVASENEQLQWALFLKPMCDKHIDGFSSKTRDAYGRLRLRHAEAVASYEATYNAGNASPPAATLDNQALEQLQSGCESALDFILNDGQPPDPRLATPAQTWNLFMSALRSGDKETLASCFDPADRPKYMQPLRSMTQPQLADLAKSFLSFDLTNLSMHDYQEGVVKTADGTIGLVLFVRSDRGWRISQL
jgi:hypothetical protein